MGTVETTEYLRESECKAKAHHQGPTSDAAAARRVCSGHSSASTAAISASASAQLEAIAGATGVRADDL